MSTVNGADDGSAVEEPSDNAFYQLPATEWGEVDPATMALLAALVADLTATVRALAPSSAGAEGDDPTPVGTVLQPAALALRLGECASQLFNAVAGAESDLRQVIATMRTALALCWDLYSADETGRVTVRQHMERLRTSIVDLEADLAALQEG